MKPFEDVLEDDGGLHSNSTETAWSCEKHSRGMFLWATILKLANFDKSVNHNIWLYLTCNFIYSNIIRQQQLIWRSDIVGGNALEKPSVIYKADSRENLTSTFKLE